MASLIQFILIFVVLTNLTLLGSSRRSSCIRLVAAQGILLGLLPLVLPEEGLTTSALVLALASIVLKGVVFPRLLLRAERTAGVKREFQPIIGYSASILLGILFLAFSMWLGTRLELPLPLRSLIGAKLAVPVSLFSILIGLLLIISRNKALTQVLGYLVMENGIYIFGVSLVREQPWLVETGILLDIFVAVFVMGIAIFHISREFDHMDVDQLTVLKD
ncbi:MAG TPA: NADH-quinone oxidoreductase subunit K [Planctomycetaceae bacterium]|nr:NADH-quinone oxidoreductase subunit K [Planctomycetaceae bacterium]